MAKITKKRNQYPDDYGVVLGNVLPDILTPLKVDEEGDKLVPRNDMAEVAHELQAGRSLRDPLGVLTGIHTDGRKD